MPNINSLTKIIKNGTLEDFQREFPAYQTENLNQADDGGWTPLALAVLLGKEPVVQALLPFVDVNFPIKQINEFVPFGDKSCKRALAILLGLLAQSTSKEKGITPFYLATIFNNADIMKLLIQHGANVDLVCAGSDFDHPLICVVYSKEKENFDFNEELFDTILRANPNVNVVETQTGMPLLHHAVRLKYYPNVLRKLLATNQINMDVTFEGKKAWEFAAVEDNFTALETFILHVDPSARNNQEIVGKYWKYSSDRAALIALARAKYSLPTLVKFYKKIDRSAVDELPDQEILSSEFLQLIVQEKSTLFANMPNIFPALDFYVNWDKKYSKKFQGFSGLDQFVSVINEIEQLVAHSTETLMNFYYDEYTKKSDFFHLINSIVIPTCFMFAKNAYDSFTMLKGAVQKIEVQTLNEKRLLVYSGALNSCREILLLIHKLFKHEHEASPVYLNSMKMLKQAQDTLATLNDEVANRLFKDEKEERSAKKHSRKQKKTAKKTAKKSSAVTKEVAVSGGETLDSDSHMASVAAILPSPVETTDLVAGANWTIVSKSKKSANLPLENLSHHPQPVVVPVPKPAAKKNPAIRMVSQQAEAEKKLQELQKRNTELADALQQAKWELQNVQTNKPVASAAMAVPVSEQRTNKSSLSASGTLFAVNEGELRQNLGRRAADIQAALQITQDEQKRAALKKCSHQLEKYTRKAATFPALLCEIIIKRAEVAVELFNIPGFLKEKSTHVNMALTFYNQALAYYAENKNFDFMLNILREVKQMHIYAQTHQAYQPVLAALHRDILLGFYDAADVWTETQKLQEKAIPSIHYENVDLFLVQIGSQAQGCIQAVNEDEKLQYIENMQKVSFKAILYLAKTRQEGCLPEQKQKIDIWLTIICDMLLSVQSDLTARLTPKQ